MVEAESPAIVDVASPAMVVVSVDMVDVDSVEVVSSVLGLLWQAASVNVVPITNRANNFFMYLFIVVKFQANIIFILKSNKAIAIIYFKALLY